MSAGEDSDNDRNANEVVAEDLFQRLTLNEKTDHWDGMHKHGYLPVSPRPLKQRSQSLPVSANVSENGDEVILSVEQSNDFVPTFASTLSEENIYSGYAANQNMSTAVPQGRVNESEMLLSVQLARFAAEHGMNNVPTDSRALALLREFNAFRANRENKKVTLYKTEICRSYEETGKCKYGDKCNFAHTDREMRRVRRHPRYKTEICRTFWEQGTCPYGKRCCFIHNESEEILQAQRMSNVSSPGIELLEQTFVEPSANGGAIDGDEASASTANIASEAQSHAETGDATASSAKTMGSSSTGNGNENGNAMSFQAVLNSAGQLIAEQFLRGPPMPARPKRAHNFHVLSSAAGPNKGKFLSPNQHQRHGHYYQPQNGRGGDDMKYYNYAQPPYVARDGTLYYADMPPQSMHQHHPPPSQMMAPAGVYGATYPVPAAAYMPEPYYEQQQQQRNLNNSNAKQNQHSHKNHSNKNNNHFQQKHLQKQSSNPRSKMGSFSPAASTTNSNNNRKRDSIDTNTFMSAFAQK